jgi:hypothetical protein
MRLPSCFKAISAGDWLLMLALPAAGCTGGMSGTSEYEQSVQVERSFADQIAAAGGTAKKEGRSLVQGKIEGVGWFIDLSGDTVSDDLIDSIIETRKQDMFFLLNLSGSTITDEQLTKLDAGKVLEYVYTLDLTDTGITDAGLDTCSHLYILTDLKIRGSKITREGAERLGERKLKDPLTPPFFKKSQAGTVGSILVGTQFPGGRTATLAVELPAESPQRVRLDRPGSRAKRAHPGFAILSARSGLKGHDHSSPGPSRNRVH